MKTHNNQSPSSSEKSIKTAGIFIDNWKLPIFKETLDSLGYKYTEHNGPTTDTIFLKVETSDMEKLGVVVKQMNAKAARSKMN